MTIHPAQLDDRGLQSCCEVRRQRRSGPGGQHRNKVETGVFVEHVPTGIRAEATEKRSQQKNLDLAMFRLRLNLAIEHRCEFERPSELWQSRIRKGQIGVNDRHADFPSLVAEALDALNQQDWDVKSTAQKLGSSTSQLVKFLKRDPRALAVLNRNRERIGLKKLR